MPANPVVQYPQTGGALPAATAAGQTLVSSGAGSTYTAQNPAMTLISEQTLGSAAASVTFSSIPQTYKHLRLVGSFSIPSGANLQVNFNSDTTAAHYAYGLTYTTGGASPSALGSASAATILVAGATGNVVIDIPGYAASSSGVQLVASFSASVAGTSVLCGNGGGAWTGTDVTSIVLTDSSGHNIAAGSVFSLYGIQ